MLKLIQTAQNCKTQECQKVPKSATTCIIKKCQKVPKGCQNASYISLLYETTMSSTCHIFGQIDYNGGSPF